jgi:Uma2 family endonuclease
MATAEPITAPPATVRRDPSPRLWSPAEFQRMRDLGVFNGHAVELVAGTAVFLDDGRPFHFTRKEYYALSDAGFFQYQRVQLIRGVILLESPMNPLHALCIRLATKALERIFGDGFDVRVQIPLDLGLDTEPHPDLAVVTGSPRDYHTDHPKSALVVVEVSDSTFESDTHEKMSLYAAAGIREYWVIDTTGRLLVFRDPRPEKDQPFGHAYGRVTAHGRDDVISPLARPDARINVADLLP